MSREILMCFRATGADGVRAVERVPVVQRVRSPLDATSAGQISRDRRSALVQFELAGDHDSAADRVEPVLAAVAGVRQRHPELVSAEFGEASANHALEVTRSDDFERAGLSSLPITLGILLVEFGALVAAGLPVLLAFSGVLATIGLASLASHLVPAGDATPAVVTVYVAAAGPSTGLQPAPVPWHRLQA